jgi:hypothetical protein
LNEPRSSLPALRDLPLWARVIVWVVLAYIAFSVYLFVVAIFW